MADPIALAVPFFFVLIAIEVLVARRRGVAVYRLTDAVTDLSCGITSQVVLLVWVSLQLGIYTWVFEHAALVRWPAPWLPWLVALLGVDFLYYWWHRLSHEVNVLWAAHVVHHQSEDYNLAVALRQAVLTSWTVLPFYLPLAVLGVPPLVYAASVAISTLYQFWIHTQLVGKVRGPLDLVLNLPSHHRVHHAVNPQYLDKNYGAILIVWDRLFGTYEEEVERPVYGLTKPLGSFDPIWAQVHYWFELAALSRRAVGLRAKLRVWLASPAETGAESPEAASSALATRPKYDRVVPHGTVVYVLAQYAVLVVVTFALMMWHRSLPRGAVVLAGCMIVGGVLAIGALFEGRRWAKVAEASRLAFGAAAVVAWVHGV